MAARARGLVKIGGVLSLPCGNGFARYAAVMPDYVWKVQLARQGAPQQLQVQLVQRSAQQHLPWVLLSAAFANASVGCFVASCAGGDEEKAVETVDARKLQKKGKELIADFRKSEDLVMVDVDEILQDPANRDGDGVKVDEVLAKAELIEAQGFDFGRVRVVLVQMPLDGNERRAIFQKNQDWKEADPRFPSWDEGRVEYSAIGGNHLVTFLKMVKQGVQCESFCSTPNTLAACARMSMENLQALDEDFATAAARAVPCIILKREVRSKPSGLADIQAAENAGAVIQTPESDKQCILRIAKSMRSPSFLAMGLDKAAKIVEAQFPQLADHIVDYFYFVERMGGLECVHFKHWKAADARFTSNRVQMSGGYMRAVGGLSILNPYAKRALAWAAKQLPKGFLVGPSGFADWFDKTRVAKLASSGRLVDSDNFLRVLEVESRKQVQLEKDWFPLYCRTEGRVARWLIEKKHVSFPEFETLDDIKQEFDIEVAEYKKSGRLKPRSAKEKQELLFPPGIRQQVFVPINRPRLQCGANFRTSLGHCLATFENIRDHQGA